MLALFHLFPVEIGDSIINRAQKLSDARMKKKPYIYFEGKVYSNLKFIITGVNKMIIEATKINYICHKGFRHFKDSLDFPGLIRFLFNEPNCHNFNFLIWISHAIEYKVMESSYA